MIVEMKKIRTCVIFLGLVAALVIVSGGKQSVQAADSVCPQIPSIKWWGKTTHQKIVNYVAAKHDGDWMPYISKWKRQLVKMQGIYKRGGTAVFKKQGISIDDKQLLQYIQAIEVRLRATRCLALLEFERDADELDGMSTASGDDELAPVRSD